VSRSAVLPSRHSARDHLALGLPKRAARLPKRVHHAALVPADQPHAQANPDPAARDLRPDRPSPAEALTWSTQGRSPNT
jgi:hypothetical protein